MFAGEGSGGWRKVGRDGAVKAHATFHRKFTKSMYRETHGNRLDDAHTLSKTHQSNASAVVINH